MEEFVKQLEEQGKTVYFNGPIKIKSGPLPKNEVSLAISDYGLHFLDLKKKDKIEMEWCKITFFNLKNKIVQVNMAKIKLSFECDPSSNVVEMIETGLMRIMKDSELKSIGLSNRSAPTQKSAFYRLKSFNNKAANELETHFRLQDTSITLNPTNFDDYIDLLPLFPTLQSVKIEIQKDGEFLTKVADFLRKDTKILHIHFDGELILQFMDVVLALLANNQSKIEAISFSNSFFTKSLFKQLKKLVNRKRYISLSFHNAFSTNVYTFSNDFMPSLNEGLQMLNLKNSSSLTLNNFLNSRLVVVSFEGCNMEISNILDALSENCLMLKNLKSVNIGGNFCTKPLNENVHFPSALTTIYANEITWDNVNMRTFFEIIFSAFRKGIRLYFANNYAEEDNWNLLSETFKTSNFMSFIELDWSQNPITKNFIDFIQRNKHIEYLNVSGCFPEHTSMYQDEFCQFIDCSTMLRELIIKKSSSGFLEKVLEDISRNEFLAFVDFSDSYVTGEFLSYIKKFVANTSSKKQITLDGLFPNDLKSLKELLNVIIESENKNMIINLPVNNMMNLVSIEFPQSEVSHYMDLFARRNSTNNEEFPFGDPFVLLTELRTKEFPEYITQGDVLFSHQSEISESEIAQDMHRFEETEANMLKIKKYAAERAKMNGETVDESREELRRRNSIGIEVDLVDTHEGRRRRRNENAAPGLEDQRKISKSNELIVDKMQLQTQGRTRTMTQIPQQQSQRRRRRHDSTQPSPAKVDPEQYRESRHKTTTQLPLPQRSPQRRRRHDSTQQSQATFDSEQYRESGHMTMDSQNERRRRHNSTQPSPATVDTEQYRERRHMTTTQLPTAMDSQNEMRRKHRSTQLLQTVDPQQEHGRRHRSMTQLPQTVDPQQSSGRRHRSSTKSPSTIDPQRSSERKHEHQEQLPLAENTPHGRRRHGSDSQLIPVTNTTPNSGGRQRSMTQSSLFQSSPNVREEREESVEQSPLIQDPQQYTTQPRIRRRRTLVQPQAQEDVQQRPEEQQQEITDIPQRRRRHRSGLQPTVPEEQKEIAQHVGRKRSHTTLTQVTEQQADDAQPKKRRRREKWDIPTPPPSKISGKVWEKSNAEFSLHSDVTVLKQVPIYAKPIQED